MAKIKPDIDDLQQNSLDNSSEGEYMNLIKEDSSFEYSEEKIQYVQRPFVENSSSVIDIKHIDNSVTYKLINVPEDDTVVTMQDSSDATFYVIGNPVEVFGTQPAVPKKQMRTITLKAKSKALTKKRDDKRRATHNEVERRRRDKINNWIMKLADLVPNARMPDSASKGGILAKACDHITHLTERQKRLEKVEAENEKLLSEVLRLNQELAELRKNTSNGNQLADKSHVFLRYKGQSKTKSEVLAENNLR